MAYYLYKTCETCGGDGVVESTYPPGSQQCWHCLGVGKVMISELDGLQSDLAEFRSDLQTFLMSWKTAETDAFTTVIQKLNQILGKLP